MINLDPHEQLAAEQHRSFTHPSSYGTFISREELAKLTNTIYKPLCKKTGNKPRYHDKNRRMPPEQQYDTIGAVLFFANRYGLISRSTLPSINLRRLRNVCCSDMES